MLDIYYPSRAAFNADCILCGLSSDELILAGYYVPRADGSILAAEYLNKEG